MKPKTLFVWALFGLMAAFIVGVLLVKAEKDDEARAFAEANREILERPHSPSLGPPEAPVVIVEFFDPACETCSAFYAPVKQMLAAHPGQIRLVLRYAPFHRGSEQVVAVLEAARRQDKFWPALEALLATQAEWAPNHGPQVALVWKHLEGLGLDMEQMAFEVGSPEIASLIAQDLADAQTLNVTKTPEFFVNARPLPSFGFEQLQTLVDQALAEARSR